MPNDLPAAVARVLEAKQRHVGRQRLNRARQFTTFSYGTGADAVDLASFDGFLPVPAPGQTVTLWDSADAFEVVDVTATYGLLENGGQLATVVVTVRPADAT